MMTFTAIVTAHAQDPSHILGVLRYQTRKVDEIILLYSGDCGDMMRLWEDFPEISLLQTENYNDWGHEKRAQGLEYANGDAIGFFNADDSYSLEYVEKMMAAIEDGADAAYCAWNTIPGCTFALGSSTSGNFVVRTGLARAVGYRDRHYEADGTFIEALRENAGLVTRVDDPLYYHNVQ
jgi:hypothetical protein